MIIFTMAVRRDISATGLPIQKNMPSRASVRCGVRNCLGFWEGLGRGGVGYGGSGERAGEGRGGKGRWRGNLGKGVEEAADGLGMA
ncbi:hypothetical protein K432DRAFT_124378 [Lepidopterella palustris CBS 459.81]|uniref:Uncharacterized protein n=1 Tax=Lepidopterella palustris CBS 459.81 TaxID=1314670 RepID=A0A8E2JC79_9PEZI|nr:hypothetical protein K432DRAFT_124378 [Lepidopterella palustris CBS 459.81]